MEPFVMTSSYPCAGDVCLPALLPRTSSRRSWPHYQKFAFGLRSFDVPPLHIHRHASPLLEPPDEDVAFSYGFYPGSVPVNDRVAYAQMMRINGGALLERMPTVGGKANPPFASYLTPAEWEDQHGTEIWRRSLDAKKRWDPNNVLTPGPGGFAEPSPG